MPQISPAFIVFLDLLEVPFKVPTIWETTYTGDTGAEIDDFGSIKKFRVRENYDVDGKLEYPLAAEKLVIEFLQSRLGKVISIRTADYELGRGVLTKVDFTVLTPFNDDWLKNETGEVFVRIANWYTTPLTRE